MATLDTAVLLWTVGEIMVILGWIKGDPEAEWFGGGIMLASAVHLGQVPIL